MRQRGTVSSHRVIGILPGQHAIVVGDEYAAWHAGDPNPTLDLNPYWLSIEFAQPRPEDDFTQWQYQQGAMAVAGWAKYYGFEIDETTVVPHSATRQGIKWGKSDPGERFDLAGFLALARDYRALM
jgi:N-acetyl-anhydromuramyl-L-alanine amidase AmpD